MKLPEEMPEELKKRIIYCKDYFNNNLPVDWRPVSEKPEKDSSVWLWDGCIVFLGRFKNNKFYETAYSMLVLDEKHPLLAWTYAHIPEPPKEIIE